MACPDDALRAQSAAQDNSPPREVSGVKMDWEYVTPAELGENAKQAMFKLMGLVYEGVDEQQFRDDLAAKDEVILLTDAERLVGFSTQQFLTIEVAGEAVEGIFSGDTVIHPDHWGGLGLMQAFSQRYIIKRDRDVYWFLISKGHRTYRMLPTFFSEFWPSRKAPTPAWEREVMQTYAREFFPSDFDVDRGVLAYQTQKDRLREGIAGTSETTLRNPEVAFFVAANPGWVDGHDLVCLTKLDPDNLRPQHRSRLLGPGES